MCMNPHALARKGTVQLMTCAFGVLRQDRLRLCCMCVAGDSSRLTHRNMTVCATFGILFHSEQTARQVCRCLILRGYYVLEL